MSTKWQQRFKRPDGALLAGVCAWIAQVLGWNVWVLRVLFIGLLGIKTVAGLATYAFLAVAMQLPGIWTPDRNKASNGLASPELSQRSQRIADLEQRFSELEDSRKN